MSERRICIGGNWKCNGTRKTITELVNKLNQIKIPSNVDVIVAPVAIHIPFVMEKITSQIAVATQNINHKGQGAYTGEIASDQVSDLGLKWTIIGHSERRQLFHTTDDRITQQIQEALKTGLYVIACCGETLDERKADKTMQIVTMQLEAIKKGVKNDEWNKVVIAYEPVWAIGTGQVATPQQAQEVHHKIRQWFASQVNENVANSIRIQYGGSVNGKNCEELLRCPDIDGFLVGGASLKGDEFEKIVTAINRIGKKDSA